MKILMQNLSEVTDFNSGRIQILLAPYDDAQIKAAIVYGGFVSNSFKVMGTYKNEERAKEIAEDISWNPVNACSIQLLESGQKKQKVNVWINGKRNSIKKTRTLLI